MILTSWARDRLKSGSWVTNKYQSYGIPPPNLAQLRGILRPGYRPRVFLPAKPEKKNHSSPTIVAQQTFPHVSPTFFGQVTSTFVRSTRYHHQTTPRVYDPSRIRRKPVYRLAAARSVYVAELFSPPRGLPNMRRHSRLIPLSLGNGKSNNSAPTTHTVALPRSQSR